MKIVRLFVALSLLIGAALLAVLPGTADQASGTAIAVSAAPDASFDLACSPPPECFTDRDCNRICGKKNGGVCVRINSCYNQCACNSAWDASAL